MEISRGYTQNENVDAITSPTKVILEMDDHHPKQFGTYEQITEESQPSNLGETVITTTKRTRHIIK